MRPIVDNLSRAYNNFIKISHIKLVLKCNSGFQRRGVANIFKYFDRTNRSVASDEVIAFPIY